MQPSILVAVVLFFFSLIIIRFNHHAYVILSYFEEFIYWMYATTTELNKLELFYVNIKKYIYIIIKIRN